METEMDDDSIFEIRDRDNDKRELISLRADLAVAEDAQGGDLSGQERDELEDTIQALRDAIHTITTVERL